jgi:uncharacterized membrane protein
MRPMGGARSSSIAVVIVTCAGCAHTTPGIVTEDPEHTTQESITVDASPNEVYRVATDYARWPIVLADVSAVTIQRGGRDDARVTFRSKALGDLVTIQLDNEPDRAVRFRGVDGPPGSHAYGEYRFEPVAGGRTRVTVTFLLRAGGLSSLFVRKATVDRMRQTKVESDLEDLARWFARGHD